MAGTVWSRWFWADWSNDPKLKLCSLAAQGLWMRMLCVAAEAEPIGYVAVAGRALGAAEIGRLAGIGSNEAETLVGELETNGVFSRDRNGTIYSRRMVRDAKSIKKSAKGGKKGGRTTFEKQRGIFATQGVAQEDTQEGAQAPMESSTFQSPSSLRSEDGPRPAYAGNPRDLIERLVEAARGNVVHGSASIEVAKPILDLIAEGCDLEVDILPVVAERVATLSEPLRTWGARWLRDAVLEHRAGRLRLRGAGPAASVAEPREATWKRKLTFWKANQTWVGSWGSAPGHPGCDIPANFVAAWKAKQEPSAA